MKVGSLFAEIGFKVKDNDLDKFAKSIKDFQNIIKSGLSDLKQYAKAAREISQAMRDAYIPNQREARARYNAQTRELSASARQRVANARRTEAELKELLLEKKVSPKEIMHDIFATAACRSAIKGFEN